MLARLQMATYDVPNNAVDQEALDRLKRDYLPMWAARAMGSAAGTGAPGEVPYVDYMKGSCSMGESEEIKIDPFAVSRVEEAIDEITPSTPLARAALAVRYMNRRGPAVYRSGRLVEVPQAEIEDIADSAERRLVPICRRKGLPL